MEVLLPWGWTFEWTQRLSQESGSVATEQEGSGGLSLGALISTIISWILGARVEGGVLDLVQLELPLFP